MTSPNTTSPALQLPHDIQLPDPVSMWPLAYGWWLLLLCVVIVLLVIVVLWRRRRRQRDPLRNALTQLHALQQVDDDRAFLSACAHWIKHQAMHHYGREQTAALQGQAWLQFLDQTGNTQGFTGGAGQQLIALYQPQIQIERPALMATLSEWLHQQYQTSDQRQQTQDQHHV